jgi:hypothetical protein
VSELFRDDRVSTNAVIEAHVARARGGVVREQLPIIDVNARTSGNGTPSSGRAMTSRPMGDAQTEGNADRNGQPTSLDIPSARQGSSTGHRAPNVPRAVAQPRSAKALLIPGVALAVAAVAVIVFFARSSHEAGMRSPEAGSARPISVEPVPLPSPAPPPPVAHPVEPARPAKPAMIDVEIRVSPESAQVAIDGENVEGNPYTGHLPSDDATHHIRATAPGYIAKSRAVVFNANVTLELSLERNEPPQSSAASSPPVRTPARPALRPVAPSRTPDAAHPEPARAPDPVPARPAEPPSETKPPAADIDPSGGTKPRRPIDPNNPYGGAP